MVCMLFRFELKWLLYGMEWENIAHPAQVEGDRPPGVSYSSWLKPTPTHTVLAISPGLRRFRVRLAPLEARRETQQLRQPLISKNS